jgi:hypothetical protein
MAREDPSMNGLLDLNLIRFLDFYFSLMFFISLYRRVGQYREVLRLVVTGPGRWPRLLVLVKQHRTVFMTWPTVLPALLALALALAQVVASRHIWPQADLTLGQLVEHWPFLVLVAPLGLAMFSFDISGAFNVGKFDRAEMEKYFDQAEYWLRSRTAHVVRIVTFGYINPRAMVDIEVRKALLDASQLLQTNLWWWVTQTTLRAAFGLALWGTWVVLGLDTPE